VNATRMLKLQAVAVPDGTDCPLAASRPSARPTGLPDLLEGIVACGNASAGVYSYVSSQAGLTYLVWLLGTTLPLLAAGPRRRRSQPSGTGERR
jgi:hypothetical protein